MMRRRAHRSSLFLARRQLSRVLLPILLRPNNDAAAFSFQTQWTRRICSRRIAPPIIPQPIHPSCQPLPCIQPHPSHTTAARRLFSTTEKTTNEEDHLFDPYEILRDLQKQTNQEDVLPKIPLPSHLSPTSLEQFHKCPQAFFFLYILKLTRDPTMTPQLARGIICHTAIEEVFDLSPDNRSLGNLENLFRREWGRVRGDRGNEDSSNDDLTKAKTKKEKEYDALFRKESGEGTSPSYDIDAEIEWGQSSLDLLRNYYDLEDPRAVKSPNPLAREMWVQARFPPSDSNDADEFIVRGKIDRIDILRSPSDDKVQLQIIDYKTGKKPWLKYSQSVNDRIASEQVWKMKVYALMLTKMIRQTDEISERSEQYRMQGHQKEDYKYGLSWALQQSLIQAMAQTPNKPKWSDILQLNSLRLTHLTSNVDDVSANDSATISDGKSIGKAVYLDYPLGSPSEFQSMLDQTELEVQTIAKDIKILVDTQSPLAFKHCDWRYCSCHELRKRFIPGSVFKDPDLDY